MNTTSLARRLEEFDASMESLRVTKLSLAEVIDVQAGDSGEPANESTAFRSRRPRRASIVIRDSGLRPFRVR